MFNKEKIPDIYSSEPIPDASNPTVKVADVLVIGQPRQRRIGPQNAGITPRQPRRGEILEVRNDNTQDTQAYPHHPSQHQEPRAKISHSAAREAIPVEAEARSLQGTAMHELHTRAHWDTGHRPATREERLEVITSGGNRTNIQNEWEKEKKALEAAANPAPVVDPPEDYDDDPPWK